MTKLFILGVLLALTTTGCGRKNPPAPVEAVAEKPAATVAASAPGTDAPPPAPAPPEPSAAAPTAPDTDDSVGSDLANTYVTDLQSIVDSYVAVTKKKPTDFAQIKAAGLLNSMPPAPAGKRYVIEPGTTKVKLAPR